MSADITARIREDIFAAERAGVFRAVGRALPRIDARAHVSGSTRYYADRSFPGLLHVVMARSERHHALIGGIDLSAAEAVKGVVRILTHKDVPNNWYTILKLIGMGPDEEPVLAEDRVLYRGEPVAAVLAETADAAREAAGKVRIAYEDLPAVLDIEAAMLTDASAIKPHGSNLFIYDGRDHFHVHCGDTEAAFCEVEHILEHSYQSSPIEHAPVETTGAIAVPEPNGRYSIHSNTQAAFFTLDNAALILGVPFRHLRVIGGTVGGGFGGKVDVIVEPIAVLGAMRTGRPVKYAFSREEEMQVSSPRAAERIRIKDGVMADGRIIARDVRILVDAGAYSRHSPYGTIKAAAHMPGPYTVPNVTINAWCVYTNRTPSSAMRGFGVTIGDFAVEVQMDRIARLLGRDPFELRLQNAYRDGEMKPHRKKVEGAALVEVVQAAAERIGHSLPPEYQAMSSSRKG
ncbi:MAG TPA: molybdopterin cofactor-binding domain-containing protein [Acetobacteraceae bacterium]|nr:molybdopterin cofactor-binding domain-containing protein [Acetobacteraceae bacterium]